MPYYRKKAPIAILNSAITIPGGKSGAKLVGFQKKSGYDSYYKEQGMNAPISKEAEAAYTTALNTLLGKDSSNKYHLHDTSVVFWSQKPTKLEQCVSFMFAPPSKIIRIKYGSYQRLSSIPFFRSIE